MNCPTCGHTNRESAKFCGGCAAALLHEATCSACGSTNPPGQKFCDECGAALRADSGSGLRVQGSGKQPNDHNNLTTSPQVRAATPPSTSPMGESTVPAPIRPTIWRKRFSAVAAPSKASASRGDPGRARELSAAGLGLAEEAGDGPLSCALELRLYFSALAFGRVSDMAAGMEAVLRRSAEDMERASPLVGYRLILPRLHERRADLARQRGDAAEAESALREAQRLYREMGAPLQVERLAQSMGC